MTPLALSLSLMRKQGYHCEVVEQNVRIARDDEDGKRDDVTYKRDLFGFADLLCVKKNRRVLVQATTLANVSHRVNKIRALVTFEHAKQAGFEVQVHGWGDAKSIKAGLRIVDLTQASTDWSSVFKAGPRRRNTPRRQVELAL